MMSRGPIRGIVLLALRAGLGGLRSGLGGLRLGLRGLRALWSGLGGLLPELRGLRSGVRALRAGLGTLRSRLPGLRPGLRGLRAHLLPLVVGGALGVVGCGGAGDRGANRGDGAAADGAGADGAGDALGRNLSLVETLGGLDTAGYERALEVRDFVFPEDHGPHPGFRTEWWYVTGNLIAESGRAFGLQLTIFRSALAPTPPGGPSVWATNQAYMGHFAVTDVSGGAFRAAELFARGSGGLAGARAAPFRVWIEDWALASADAGDGTGAAVVDAGGDADGAGPDEGGDATTAAAEEGADATTAAAEEGADDATAAPEPVGRSDATTAGAEEGAATTAAPEPVGGSAARDEAGGESLEGGIFPLRLTAETEEMAVDLVLEEGKPRVLQGDRGLSQKGPEPGNASYYYAHTRMPARGHVVFEGESYRVSGLAWLDREWSTSALSAGQVGWDWFALQLDDGWEMMVYQLRRDDGTADPLSDGVLIDSEGRRVPLEWGREVSVTPTGTWSSPVDGAEYPSGWRIRVPERGWDLSVEPVVADQELRLAFRYWEGAVRIEGSGEGGDPVTGRGYVELTGYAGRELTGEGGSDDGGSEKPWQ